MMDETALFDSDEEEDLDEDKKKTPEDKKMLFRKELGSMLYGFGDAKVGIYLKIVKYSIN